MSERLWKWILVILIAVVCLYAVYPPVRVAIKKVRVERKIARTAVEATKNDVEVGESYKAKEDVIFSRFLPFARGERNTEVTVVEQKPDGTLVEDETTYVEGRIKPGLDIAGGTELLYQIKPKKGEEFSGKVLETIKILQERIDPQNVKEYRIQPAGADRILIQIPRAGRAEVERLKERLIRMGLLEFKIAIPRGDTKFADDYQKSARGEPVSGYEKLYVENDKRKEFYLVKEGEPAITGQYLAEVNKTQDSYGRWAVGFRFNAQGSKKFASITERNTGWLLAIILDDALKSAPVIKDRIAGAGIIEGEFTEVQVNDLITVLRSGSLAVDLNLLQESTVGPQLGRDSIRMGLGAAIVGAIIVVGFMACYYLGCGLVADAALAMNMLMLFGVMGLMGAGLSLPGVAGIALAVGMGVDANILIFERIREELSSGKSAHVALRNGFERAYSAIIDSNVTTALAGIILYVVGTGPVRGFAVTLTVGVTANVFTAVFVTRLMMETLLDKGWFTKFKMFSLIGRPRLSYTRLRRYAYVLSGLVVLVGMGAFFARGSALYDVDFTGGSLIQISLAKPTPAAEVRKRLAENGFANAEVQGISSPAATAEGTTDFNIRVKGTGAEEAHGKLLSEFQSRLSKAGILHGGNLALASDKRSIEVTLGKAVSEMDLRKALADKEGGPFQIEHISSITMPEEMKAKKFLLRGENVSLLIEPQELWSDMIEALSWGGMETEPCALQIGDIGGSAEPEGPALAELKTDRAVQWQVLTVEAMRRGFPQIKVTPKPGSDTLFELSATRRVLEQFKLEMPSDVSLPKVNITDLAVEGALTQSFSEQDLRAVCEQRGLTGVQIVPLDLASERFRLDLSQEQIKEKLASIFGDLAARGMSVEFKPLNKPPDEKGRVFVEMHLSEPLTIPQVEHYLQEGGVARTGGGMIVDQLPPDVTTSTVTLRIPAKDENRAQKLIEQTFAQPNPVQKVISIGAVVAEEMKGRAVLAILGAWVVIILYVAVRFHAFRFGVAAVIALIHDVLVTAGLVALADWSGLIGDVKINLPMIAAFLTIIGYSVNDTIVIFDRVRENMAQAGRKLVPPELIDDSVNQTMSRTLLTTGTTLATVTLLFLIGGPVLRGLAFALIVGMVSGTYSTIFIASPIVLDWEAMLRGARTAMKVVFFPVRLPFLVIRTLRHGGSRA